MSSINAKVPPLRLFAVDTPTDGQIPSYQSSSGEFEWVDDSSGGGTPGGSNNEIQFNNSGAFGGDAGFVMSVKGAGSSTVTQTGNILTGGNKIATATSGGSVSIICDGTGEIFLQSGSDAGGTFTDSIVNIKSNANTDNAQLKFRDGSNTDNGSITLNGSGHMVLSNNVTNKDIQLEVTGTGIGQLKNGDTDTDTMFKVLGTGTPDFAGIRVATSFYDSGADFGLESDGTLEITNNKADEDIDLKVLGAGVVEVANQTTNNSTTLSIKGNGTGDSIITLSNNTKSISLKCDENNKLKVAGALNNFVFDASSGTGGITWPDGTTQTTAASGGGASAIGDLSDATTDGTNNIGMASGALDSGSFSGNNNVAVGPDAGTEVTSGSNNTLLGSFAGSDLTTGGNNVAIGRSALFDDASSNHTIAIGTQTGEYQSGDYNIALGGFAGRWHSGDYNISIGYEANDAGGGNTGNGNVVIGNKTDLDDVTADRQLKIAGNDGTNTTLWIKGDSTGKLTINEAYSLPTAVTSTNDYVLTAQTDGTTAWAAAGGGNEFNAELCGTNLDATGTNYNTYDLLSLPPYGQASYTSGTLDAKRIFFPFLSPVSGDLDTLYWNITAAASSAQNIYAGVWADNEGIPGTMLGYVTIDATSSGSQSSSTWSSTVTLVRGTQYHFGFNRSNTESHTYRACQTTGRPRVSPYSGLPSNSNSWGTGFVTTGTVTGVPTTADADDLEPVVVFSGLNYPMHIGVTFS
tara:strand:+ start:669 stop:2903 length:2235 start_codon:yes stop_codon:yes gene_type:complete